ncbi:MAG: class I SAM-dependent methyltransferase [Verrucomicrobia bacterium]|jgi:predicted O-methyltransferase YrrM|nr:class I SAM-dependent methyltransferase [Verrucomicrobiota bacterium]
MISIRSFIRYTALGRILMIPVRFLRFGVPRLAQELGYFLRWSCASKEYYNWTYDLTPLNRDYLASYIAVVTGHEVATIEGYIRELENDAELRQRLRQQTLSSPDRHSCDAEPRYGKRLGWYALVRATKPRVILETGVDRGLGTAVMAAALYRNQREGYPGLVFATDIVRDCGHLLVEPYRQCCRLLIGDSIESIRKFDQPVDIFLHDSLHTPEYEWGEFLAVEPRLHEASLVMSDNSLMTTKLREFAQRRGLEFLYFQDQPKDHWWPGDGIGTAFRLGTKAFFAGAKSNHPG